MEGWELSQHRLHVHVSTCRQLSQVIQAFDASFLVPMRTTSVKAPTVVMPLIRVASREVEARSFGCWGAQCPALPPGFRAHGSSGEKVEAVSFLQTQQEGDVLLLVHHANRSLSLHGEALLSEARKVHARLRAESPPPPPLLLLLPMLHAACAPTAQSPPPPLPPLRPILRALLRRLPVSLLSTSSLVGTAPYLLTD